MTFEHLPKNKPFRFTGKDLTIFMIDDNNSILIWFRDLKSWVSMPSKLNGSWYKKLKSKEEYLLLSINS